MNAKHKSISSEKAAIFGAKLRRARNKGKLTLIDVSLDLGIDASQLSRFERGQFVRSSTNLQKYSAHLQINVAKELSSSLAERVMVIAARSTKHREAIEEIVTALERIG